MRKSILWFVFLTLLTIQSAFAQGFFVKGKVISQEDNEPVDWCVDFARGKHKWV